MSFRIDRVITCDGDGCEVEVLYSGEDAPSARRRLRDKGWLIRSDRDLCPNCRKKDWKYLY